jgi:hypothetical protein
MIEYIELNAPTSMIDGNPAFKAGEWPGIKSNRFPKTKKIIQIRKKSNIFTLDDSSPIKSQKKRIIPIINDQIPIQSKKRRIASALYSNPIKTKEVYNDLFPTPLQNYNRLVINREYDFEKKAKYYQMIQDTFDRKKKEHELLNRTKNNSIGMTIQNNNPTKGFDKKFFQKVSSNKILGVTLTQDLYKKYKYKLEKMKTFKSQRSLFNLKKRKKSLKRLGNNRKLMEIINKQKELKHDMDYVASLDEIESRARNIFY